MWTDVDAYTAVVSIKENNGRMKYYRHPFFERHYGVYLFQWNTVKRRHRVDTTYYQRIYRAFHVDAYVVMLARILKQHGYIQTIGAGWALVVSLVESFDDAFGNHIGVPCR